MTVRRIAYFISPHGFGHASRSAAIMEELGRQVDDVSFQIISTVPEWFFSQSLSVPFEWVPIATDVGLVQIDPVREDLPATVRRLEAFWSRMSDEVADIVERWRAASPDLVVADISPLGLEAARRARLPSVLIENFTWDWIYDAYRSEAPELVEFGARYAETVSTARLRIQCEPICRLAEGAVRVRPVSREPGTSRAETRRMLGLEPDDSRPLVLLTMGGLGWGEDAPAGRDDLVIVTLGGVDELTRRGGLIRLPNRSPVYPPDVVWAADAVVAKLGYSTVAECYRAGTRFGYITRHPFPESPVLEAFAVRELPAHRFGREIEADPLRAAQLFGDDLDRVLALPRGARRERNGATEAADLLRAVIV